MTERTSMANIERGEIDITVNDKTYTLKLSMNAAATAQSRTKRTMGELLEAAQALDFVAIRDLMWVLLQKYHAADFKTVEQVGNLIDDGGGLAKFFESIAELSKANGGATAPAAEGAAGNPPQAQAGTSVDSTLTPVASA